MTSTLIIHDTTSYDIKGFQLHIDKKLYLGAFEVEFQIMDLYPYGMVSFYIKSCLACKILAVVLTYLPLIIRNSPFLWLLK